MWQGCVINRRAASRLPRDVGIVIRLLLNMRPTVPIAASENSTSPAPRICCWHRPFCVRARTLEMTIKVGSGFDIHAFGPGDSLVLAGVRVPHTHGIVAHSDGDVLLHALVDALLGASR